VKLANSDQHSTLLWHGIIYSCKKFYCTGPGISTEKVLSEKMEESERMSLDKVRMRPHVGALKHILLLYSLKK
jgi:hypothetical protein